MKILWDVDIPMSDGSTLNADIFLPNTDGPSPTIMSMGPYGKSLDVREGFANAWARMTTSRPDTAEGSSNAYQVWELPDPEKWTQFGYACVRIDARGSGRSPGKMDVWSQLEARDYYEAIEWAAAQPWSTGRIGLLGISYLATNQWHVAGLQPPHLSAICVWEGFADYYRDLSYHGGIPCDFVDDWFHRQVKRVQYGLGSQGYRNPITGRQGTGDEDLTDEQREQNRVDPWGSVGSRPLDGAYYDERSPYYEKITVPLLSAGNWGGQGLHLRGNVEGYLSSRSEQKWLRMHGGTHFTPFYVPEGVELQKQFFDYFLKGEENGWGDRPAIELNVRHADDTFELRYENEWPLARTQWTTLHLTGGDQQLVDSASSDPWTVSYETMGDGARFDLPPADHDREFTGPVAARLTVSSQTTDADLFLVLRLFNPEGKEMTFVGANDPAVPVAAGWLRVSHRETDPELSKPYRPYHTHTTEQPLEPGVPVTVDVEFWPTSIVVPAGYTLSLNVRGCDYSHGEINLGEDAPYPVSGVGPFTHTKRPAEVFDTTVTIHGGDHENWLLLPLIPSE